MKSVQYILLIVLPLLVKSSNQASSTDPSSTPNSASTSMSTFVISSAIITTVNPTFPCSNGQTGVDLTEVCDYYDDCGDGSDETNCTNSQSPVNEKIALLFSITDLNSSTSKIVNLFGNPNNYVPFIDGLSSHAANSSSSSHSSALPVRLSYRSAQLLGLDLVKVLTVDSLTNLVYASDGEVLGYESFVDSTSVYTFNEPPRTKQINGIAIDWISKVLYWTDHEFRMIAALPASTAAHKNIWKPIVTSNLTSPQDVAVNPLSFYLFWSDEAKIERSDLAGNNRTVLLASDDGLVLPTTLVVDLSSGRLYWLDAAAGVIGSCLFDGLDPILTKQRQQFDSLSSMAIYESYIFLGIRETPTISVYHKSNVTYIGNFTANKFVGGVVDMVMYSNYSSQPTTTSPCRMTTGGEYVRCEQFCWSISSTKRQCDCAIGFFLSSNGSCGVRPFSPNTSFLIVADTTIHNVFQLQPESGQIRALWTIDKPVTVLELAVDSTRNVLYTVVGKNIHKTMMNDHPEAGDIIYSGFRSSANVRHLSFDYIHDKLYFVHDRNVCELSTDTPTGCRKMNNDGSTAPEAVVIDPMNRRLYWSDCARPSSIRSVSTTDGQDLQTVVSNSANDTSNGCFTNLAIDLERKNIYWTTNWINGFGTPVVEKASLNGSGRTTLFNDSSAQFTGLALLGDCLYISDSNRRSLLEYNLTKGSLTNRSLGMFTYVQTIASFAQVPPDPTTTTTRSSTVSTTTIKPSTTTTSYVISDNSTITAPTSNNSAVIAGVVCGVIGFLIVVVIIVVVIKSRYLKNLPFKPITLAKENDYFDMNREELPHHGADNIGFDEFVSGATHTEQEHSM